MPNPQWVDLTNSLQARILPRVERPRPPLPFPPCLLPFAMQLLSTRGYDHYVPGQLSFPRAGHELHHQEAPWVRIPGYDAATAHCCSSEVPLLQRTDYPQCKLLLRGYGIL